MFSADPWISSVVICGVPFAFLLCSLILSQKVDSRRRHTKPAAAAVILTAFATAMVAALRMSGHANGRGVTQTHGILDMLNPALCLGFVASCIWFIRHPQMSSLTTLTASLWLVIGWSLYLISS